jgi:hypothetical protein
MSATNDRYLSCVDTAKLVRKALRADFPGVKFSVRSSTYAGGASIDVGWTDGPTSKQVDGTLKLYEGASFDGMIDLKSYHDSILMGENGPEVVHFGADYVMGQRRVSDLRTSIYRVELERFVGEKLPRRSESAYGSMRLPVSFGHYYSSEFEGQSEHPALARDDHNGEYLSTLIHQMAYARPWHDERCPGGQGVYCPGCGRFQTGHESEPHKR